MRDTAPWAEAKLAELYRRRSGGERLAMACATFDAARALAAAGIRSREPGIGAEALRLRVFERMYTGDFEPERWQWLLRELAARERGKPGV
ncbi:MAG: hypothetical protein ACRD1L_04055 [Terriglobales bacterium]